MSDAGTANPNSGDPRQRAGSTGGLVLAPFRGWRYVEAVVGDLGAVLAPPNDVISAEELRDLRARSPWNAAALNRPTSYAAAASALADWVGTGALQRDPAPALYAYEQTQPGGVAVRGLMGALALRPPADGVVLRHENTRPGPVADRLALMTATGADLEPIMVVYDGGPVVAAALSQALAAPLLAEATTPDEVRHRLAAVTDHGQLEALATELLPRRALIADGHHRYASYLERQAERRASGLGDGAWDFGLTLLVDGAQAGLRVQAIHRVLERCPLEAALASVTRAARVTPLPAGPDAEATVRAWLSALAAAAQQPGRTAFVVAAGRRGFVVDGFDAAAVAAAVDVGAGSEALRHLPVTAMARYLLPVVLGHAETDGVDVTEAARAVALAEDTGGTAILLPPVTFMDVLRVAAAGDRMPRKSTLFLPKPASGLTIRRVEPPLNVHPGHLVSDVSSTS